MKKDIRNEYKIKTPNSQKVQPHYEVSYEMDWNDADYVNETIEIDDIYTWDDFTLYFISYVAHGRELGGKFNADWNDGAYGRHIADNKDLPFLYDFMSNNDWLLWGNECEAHSVTDFKIKYIDENGLGHTVLIPDFDELFDTREEMIAEMTRMYNESKKSGRIQ